MKKLIYLILLSVFILNCTPKKPQPTAKEGMLLQSIRGAYDSLQASEIEIYYFNDTFFIYRSSVSRQDSDKMGVFINSTQVGIFQRVSKSKFKLVVPNDSNHRIAIPFDPSKPVYQINQGEWNYCCDCPIVNLCCQAMPQGLLGYICTGCPQYTCNYCIAVATDFTGGSNYIFTHASFNGGNFKVVE